jgi:flagellar hook-associated protein 1
MSLFGAIQMGGNTLRAMQIGLHVVGNNIANANTPGFIREEVVYAPAPLMRKGNLILGLGVQVDGIIQKVDKFVLERLAGARGDRAAAEAQEDIYRDIEVLLNEVSAEGGLSSALTGFFNAIHEVMMNPGDIPTRSLAIDAGAALTQTIGTLQEQVQLTRVETNERISAMVGEINTLSEEIARLNVRITSTEGGDTSGSDAGALRVARQEAVNRLSELVGVHVEEQPSGGINVSVGGDLLVFEGQRREVELAVGGEEGAASTVQLIDTKSPLDTASGELYGLYRARDEIIGGFLEGLDHLAGTLAFEFNKAYSQGQGLVGFSELTSVEAVSGAAAALDAAGLTFTPVNGTFDVIVHNKNSGPNEGKTHTISVDLNGFGNETTLNSLAAELDAIEGLSASVTSDGELSLSGETTDIEFAFARDTSGALAALGLNTFFTGSTAGDLGVNEELGGRDDPAKFAASDEGIGVGSGNAAVLAAFLDRPIDSAGGATLVDLYDQIVNDVAQGASVAQAVAEGFRVFEGTLEGQGQAISGVSLDEEAIKMITLQRIYQASARYIQTVSELLDLLVNL